MKLIDFIAKLPSTNLQVCVSIIGFFMSLISALASYMVPWIAPIPEGALPWIFGFVAAYGGISTAHFTAKRKTHIPNEGEQK